MKKIVFVLLILFAGAAYAAEKPAWKDFTFFFYKPVKYKVFGELINIKSEVASSMFYRAMSEAEKKKNNISWSWRIDSSNVKKTKLDIAKGADRTIGVYIFFSKKPLGKNASITSNGNYIAYIWGGDHKVGEVLKAPDKKGRMFIVRSYDEARQKWLNEEFDYKKDFERVFGYKAYPAFIAISADTDDSKATTIAAIKNFVFAD